MPTRQLSESISRPEATLIFLIITAFASLIIFFAIIYFLYYLWYSLVHRSRTSPFDSTTPLVKLQKFTYKELKSATNGFNTTNTIGKGGSGTVYGGLLKDGRLIAIKLLDSNSVQSEREFQNELQVLGWLRKSPLIVSLLGYCVEKNKRLVVYEYMPNKSLQESLFSESNSGLNWPKRFDIILDIVKALAFLHLECDPPVIHGDVKPSNVLLDSEYRAKLSDFGLARLKLEGEFGVDMFSQDLGKSQELSGNLGIVSEDNTLPPPISIPTETHDVDFAFAVQASSSSSKNVKKLASNSLDSKKHVINENGCKGKNVLKGKEVSSIENVEDYEDEDDNHIKDGKPWGKDWWWKQDGSGELSSKDYVKEWIGTQICSSQSQSVSADWEEERKCSPEKSKPLDKFEEVNETESKMYDKKHRKMQEWWKEEHFDELSKKSKANNVKFKKPKFSFKKRKTNQKNQILDNQEREFSFIRGRKRKNSPSFGSGDMWSGDILSRELSSTTSMRGTLCYVAPEYGGCGYLMEKSDIYSLGVLILVIISGRRPLHVLSSPMKLEKANLISWCRQLAQGGNVLELVDERLKDEYKKDEASLCINIALACIQKMPELRPEIGDIVKILTGEMELPPLPFEFSPSPPSKLLGRSRRKQKSSG